MTTVLFVEDDPNSVRILQRVLTRQGGFVAKHTEDVEEVMLGSNPCTATKQVTSPTPT
jgi:ActR/RegA family two-component response regulator